MNRPNLTTNSTRQRPLGREPRTDLMSIAGGALMFSGAAAVVFALLAALSTAAEARTAPPSTQSSGPVIYPAKGQTEKEQSKDRFECYEWSKGQSGYDPAQAVDMTARAATPQQGNTTGAMVGGAVGGAAIAEVTNHDAGRGAAIGALGGGMRERMRERQAAQAMQQQAAQQQAARGQQRSLYDRAFGACMEARGYTVK